MRTPTLLSFAALSVLAVSACAPVPPAAGAIEPAVAPDGEDPTRWTEEVAATIAARGPVERPVVFLGSSSIRRWSSLGEDMAPIEVVNHGFGGSRIHDAVHWLEDLLEGVDLRALVVFSGTNDVSGSAPRDAAYVAERFDALVGRMRALGHDVPLIYIAISPTPSREEHLDIVREANRLVAQRCAEDPMLTFVDTATGLLDGEGRPDPRWFQEDLLHLNPAGYAAWTEAIRPAVEGAIAR
ncbi:MAG: GDSL-type esterase/lipase family protein [Planctomycetota bacterium]|nr:GDSL-type esterase/lipase family protein [Planctomycetota bacterium]